ncbi:HET-domain-containing protein [Hypoxylon sp. FL1857]|nr:HET-domain-containing protein [Hypoxylon sp. FL1857]
MWCFSNCLTRGKSWIPFVKGGQQSKYEPKASRELTSGCYPFSYSDVPLHRRKRNSGTDLDNQSSNAAKAPKIIRLLKVLPNIPDQLVCQIRSVELDGAETLDYDAISYTWNSPTRGEIKNEKSSESDRAILCNGKHFFVRENLYNCLMQLRENCHRRDLWVDAICINQESYAERSEQVSIMADIYRSAQCVIVWLGIADKFTKPAWDLIWALKQVPMETWSTMTIRAFDTKNISEILGCENCGGQWKALASLFGRTWFTRAWVVQEIVLARKITVLCGGYTFDWDAIVSASEFMAKQASANTFKADLFCNFDANSLSYKNPAKLDAIKRDILNGTGDILLRSLIRCRTYEASRDHDKVYSLLGLANCQSYGRHNLYPDYERSISEVYTDISEYLLENSGDLHLLAHAEGDEFKSTCGLPTWVVDWSVKKDLGLRITGYARYEAAGKLPCFKEIRSRGTLILRGFELDTISRIGETKAKVNDTKDCTDWLDLLGELEQEFPDRGHKDAFWRTLLVDTDPSRSVPVKRPWENSFDVWMGLCKHEPSDEEKQLALDYETSFTHSLNLRLFRTAGGHLGCGTLSCKKGDSIWIAQGSRVPLILRPTQQEGSTTFGLVGGTYLHGFMQGEALDGREFREVTLI